MFNRAGKIKIGVTLALLFLLCGQGAFAGRAFAEEPDGGKYGLYIWARTEGDSSEDIECPNDALLLTVNGQTNPVGFTLDYEPLVESGTTFFVAGRNLEKYHFYGGYILRGRGGAKIRDITGEEADVLNNGEELEFTTGDFEFTLCFLLEYRDNLTPTPTPVPVPPTPTPEPVPEPVPEPEPESDGGINPVLVMFLGVFLIMVVIIVFVFLLFR